MKKLISLFLLAIMTCNMALADCDFSKTVHNPDGTVTYSKELHICVGIMKQDLSLANTQLTAYKSAIDLKDLALSKTNDRSDLWMNTSFKLQDRMNAIDELKSKNEMLYFTLGALTIIGAGLIVKHTLN